MNDEREACLIPEPSVAGTSVSGGYSSIGARARKNCRGVGRTNSKIVPDRGLTGRTNLELHRPLSLRRWYVDCSITDEQEVSLRNVVRHEGTDARSVFAPDRQQRSQP